MYFVSLQTLWGQPSRKLRSFRCAAAAWRRPRVERFSSWRTGSAWPQRALMDSWPAARVPYWNMKWCVPPTPFSCWFCARTTATGWWSTSAAPAVASSAERWVHSHQWVSTFLSHWNVMWIMWSMNNSYIVLHFQLLKFTTQISFFVFVTWDKLCSWWKIKLCKTGLKPIVWTRK